ncbi:hypothetical protein [Methanobacterium alcaliphilum]|uniref:hypothetical protein n=1 Tax=Methanobacterium alcaliphilum TaxID=392018 RepID=UPI00200A8250|nr:hypothetical protein [Methanobacterium alcaliphilum]MCK9152283.1 hypothetical protein [Methanobacterium alcaliphilum]
MLLVQEFIYLTVGVLDCHSWQVVSTRLVPREECIIRCDVLPFKLPVHFNGLNSLFTEENSEFNVFSSS